MSEEKILLVEDEEVTALAEAERLKKYGYAVEISNSAKNSLQSLQEGGNIDLILMDIELEGQYDGIEAAREIHKDYDIPLLFLTSHDEPEFLEKAAKTTSYNYLLKKNSSESLLNNAIKQALKLYRAKNEIENKNRRLKEKEVEYRKIVQAAYDPMAIIKNYKLTFLNQAFAKLIGQKVQSLLEESIYEIHSFSEVTENLEKLKGHEQSESEFEFELLTLSDSIRNIKARLIEIQIQSTFAYILIFHDFTEQKQLLENLQRARDMESELDEFIPICARCKRVREEKAEEIIWVEPERYINNHLSDVKFSHGICPDCIEKFYPDFYEQVSDKLDQEE